MSLIRTKIIIIIKIIIFNKYIILKKENKYFLLLIYENIEVYMLKLYIFWYVNEDKKQTYLFNFKIQNGITKKLHKSLIYIRIIYCTNVNYHWKIISYIINNIVGIYVDNI